ncbi:hypothetical protein ACU4GA_12110 [Methylobacterium oryzae CBMB20]
MAGVDCALHAGTPRDHLEPGMREIGREILAGLLDHVVVGAEHPADRHRGDPRAAASSRGMNRFISALALDELK